MLGIRNLYKAFQESRTAAERRATVAVNGTGPDADALAALLGARREHRGAEIVLTILGKKDAGLRLSLSGKAVERPGMEVFLPALMEGAVGEALAPRLARVVDDEYLVPLGLGYPLLRKAACEHLVGRNARQNAIIGALPIPGADMPAITANQGRMVLGIAAAYGEELSLERARELLGVLAAGFGMRTLARQVLKVVPVAGWAASAAVGYAGTLAMGRTAILYFERGKVAPGEGERREIFRRSLDEARAYLSRPRKER
jgi:uncharacterized protein (DUF697 family)